MHGAGLTRRGALGQETMGGTVGVIPLQNDVNETVQSKVNNSTAIFKPGAKMDTNQRLERTAIVVAGALNSQRQIVRCVVKVCEQMEGISRILRHGAANWQP